MAGIQLLWRHVYVTELTTFTLELTLTLTSPGAPGYRAAAPLSRCPGARRCPPGAPCSSRRGTGRAEDRGSGGRGAAHYFFFKPSKLSGQSRAVDPEDEREPRGEGQRHVGELRGREDVTGRWVKTSECPAAGKQLQPGREALRPGHFSSTPPGSVRFKKGFEYSLKNWI